VGEIVEVKPHPNADRLNLAVVDYGRENTMTVVTGAPHLLRVDTGKKVVFATTGARLIDSHSSEKKYLTLKPTKIRGVFSEGMVCSEKELGISDSHEGIMVLPAEAPVGTLLSDYLGDVIFDLDVTPNRPDCLSVIGIAREVAALTDQSVRLPEARYDEGGSPIDQQISIEIVALEPSVFIQTFNSYLAPATIPFVWCKVCVLMPLFPSPFTFREYFPLWTTSLSKLHLLMPFPFGISYQEHSLL